MVLEFDTNGFLMPYSPIRADMTILEEVFVSSFPTSASRRPLFDRYVEAVDELSKLLPDGFVQWIDGSFVSQKLNPQDIDVLTFVDDNAFTLLEKELAALRVIYRAGSTPIDLYRLRVYPEGHRYRNHYESDYIHWLFDWSRTYHRPIRNKGFIELTF